MVMTKYLKTLFPRFDDELASKKKSTDVDADDAVPDCDATSGSETSDDDSASSEQRRAKYETKEDEDVAVFMEIAKRLPVSSLVHLLKGHAMANNRDHLQYGDIDFSSALTPAINQKKHKSLKKIKKFRFAEVSGNNVRCVVHEVESLKSRDLWWNESEIRKIRGNAIKDVKHYRKYRPDFIETVEMLTSSTSPDYDGDDKSGITALVEEHMKKLTQDSYARGLETHIVCLLSSLRREAVQAVLEEQEECKRCADLPEVVCESLREQSVAYSGQSRRFAERVAKCDHIEALKASISAWAADA